MEPTSLVYECVPTLTFSLLMTWHYMCWQVRQLLVDDPENHEYADMQKELEEVM